MRLLSLCSGIGGIELGLETVQSFRLVGFAERDTFCRWVLKSRWPGIPIFSDISEVSVECDMITAGFPCQPCRSLGAPHHRQRLFLLADSHPQGRETEGRPKGEGQPNPSRCLGMLADSNCGQSESGLEPKRQSQHAPNDRPTFWPPGPTGNWEGLTPWPSEPGFCRVAHGSSRGLVRPSYTARIRALGNSVSPPVAAVAYTELSRRLFR